MGVVAQPLRALMMGGWYHVSSRANRRLSLFLNEALSPVRPTLL
jgi:hypothetical protein